jgi:pyruvate dehydrogenase E2 component (dihydrolipoamide acetyltransferase)
VATEIVMPKLSDTMEEGTILRWLKKEGEAIRKGEVIAEVETDKADMELEASASGTLASIKVAEGESAAVGAVLALVEAGDGAREESKPARETDGKERGEAPAERPREHEAREEAPARAAKREASREEPRRGGDRRTDERRSQPAENGVKSSPSARQLADEHGIDLASVRGSGPGGRIVKEDGAALIERAPRGNDEGERGRPAEREREEPPRRARGADDGSHAAHVSERHELSRMRRSIARRMSESFREVPHFMVTAEIDMTEAVRLKEQLKASGAFATTPTYTHMVLRAVALALRKHPRLNASYRDDAIEIHADVNLGMAVAVEDGLIVPILRRVDERDLEEVATEARRLAEQAVQGRFSSEDLLGGTFTVSNLGMFDIEAFTAVINPPQAGILAVGSIKDRAVVRAGQVTVARTMFVTLSCDHRIVDGAVASRFLEDLKQLLENPITLVLHGR